MSPSKDKNRNERDERNLDSAVKKMQRKGVDTSKMPGPAVRDGRKGNA